MYCIIANAWSDSALRKGAKVYVLSSEQNAHGVEVIGLSKIGRKIKKYVAWKRLENLRPATVPPGLLKDCRLWWDDRNAADVVARELTEPWKNARVFHPDGRLLRDGIPAEVVLREYCRTKGIRNFTNVAPIESIRDVIRANEALGFRCAQDAMTAPSTESTNPMCVK